MPASSRTHLLYSSFLYNSLRPHKLLILDPTVPPETQSYLPPSPCRLSFPLPILPFCHLRQMIRFLQLIRLRVRHCLVLPRRYSQKILFQSLLRPRLPPFRFLLRLPLRKLCFHVLLRPPSPALFPLLLPELLPKTLRFPPPPGLHPKTLRFLPLPGTLPQDGRLPSFPDRP